MNDFQTVIDIIKLSLWNEGDCRADAAVFEELDKQALTALPVPVLSAVSMPDDLRKRWQTAIFRQVSHNTNCRHAQAALPVTVPYVILKGTSAAQYYPHPEYRTLGDIDIMPRREDFSAVCDMLLNAGYTENTILLPDETMRHRAFLKDQVEVEVHAYFARLNDPACAEYLDDLIIQNISPSHVLPDPVNGLVILEHISQHLEEGLGLRQIIDWMMFVHRCLLDEQWPEFQAMAQATGLEKLALVATRMCELYLGLPARAWCAGTDENLCKRLMDYVLDSGNFGIKRTSETQVSERVLYASKSPAAILTLLQRKGLSNWKAAGKHPVLRPFAWLYQLGRYARKGMLRKDAFRQLKEEYQTVQSHRELLDALGASQYARGYAVFQDGKYLKE